LQNLCARSRASAPNANGVNQSIGLQLATLTFKNQLIDAHSCLRRAMQFDENCELWRSVSLWSGAIVFLRIIVCAGYFRTRVWLNEAAKCLPDAIFGVRTFILQGRV
jgi:hypothetical protein